MALFQVHLKEGTEGIEVYCVLIVSDDATCITFFEAQVLDSGFPSGLLNYTGCCSTLSLCWDVNFCSDTHLCVQNNNNNIKKYH